MPRGSAPSAPRAVSDRCPRPRSPYRRRVSMPQPRLATLSPVVSVGSIRAGFNSTKLFTATRRIELGRLTLVDLVSQAAGLVVMVAWALSSRSIWALVAGGVGGNFFRLILSHVL